MNYQIKILKKYLILIYLNFCLTQELSHVFLSVHLLIWLMHIYDSATSSMHRQCPQEVHSQVDEGDNYSETSAVIHISVDSRWYIIKEHEAGELEGGGCDFRRRAFLRGKCYLYYPHKWGRKGNWKKRCNVLEIWKSIYCILVDREIIQVDRLVWFKWRVFIRNGNGVPGVSMDRSCKRFLLPFLNPKS